MTSREKAAERREESEKSARRKCSEKSVKKEGERKRREKDKQEQEVKVQGKHGDEGRGWTQKECVGDEEKKAEIQRAKTTMCRTDT